MKLYIIPILLLIIGLSSCSDDDSFDNKVSNISSSNTSDVLFKKGVVSAERTLQATMAKTESHDVTVTYEVNPSLVSTYNYLYDSKAIILDAAYYSIPNQTAVIKAGSIYSSEIKVNFSNLDKLNEDSVYVLPVSIVNATSLGILDSKRTTYFVVKGASLINTVADINNTFLNINWANPGACDNLSQLTMEGLLYVNSFNPISTFMGVEQYFLLRFGDGYPVANIQLALKSTNYPASKDVALGLPTNKWVHVALTYDTSTKIALIYINGQLQTTSTTSAMSAIKFGTPTGSFKYQIGRSYADDRYLDGYISECRIWNVVRTQAEIAENPYYVDPKSSGLVAYWKFDDGAGNTVKDYTANGNNAIVGTKEDGKTITPIKWVSVSLPEK